MIDFESAKDFSNEPSPQPKSITFELSVTHSVTIVSSDLFIAL